MGNDYFPVDENIELKIKCSEGSKSPGFSPGCSVKSNYRPGIVLSYFYNKDYFSDWREIDLKLKALLDRFEQAAQPTSIHEEE